MSAPCRHSQPADRVVEALRERPESMRRWTRGTAAGSCGTGACVPQSCVNDSTPPSSLPRTVHVQRLQTISDIETGYRDSRPLWQVSEYAYGQLATYRLVINKLHHDVRGPEPPHPTEKQGGGGKLNGAPGVAALWAIEFGPMLSRLLSVSWIWALVWSWSHPVFRGLWSLGFVCARACVSPPTGS